MFPISIIFQNRKTQMFLLDKPLLTNFIWGILFIKFKAFYAGLQSGESVHLNENCYSLV